MGLSRPRGADHDRKAGGQYRGPGPFTAAIIVTPLLLGLVVWLGPQWLDGRYAKVQTVSEINTRVSRMESRQNDQAQFQRDMLSRLDRMQESINTLSTSIGALAATQAQRQ